MEVPTDVLVHNTILGWKGSPGRLLRIAPEGYYELNVSFGEKTHRVLLPIHSTVLMSKEAESPIAEGIEIER